MPVSRRVVGGDERAPRVAGPQQHGLSAATSESTVSATTRHGHRPRVMGELVRIAATMALRTHASPTSSLSRDVRHSDTRRRGESSVHRISGDGLQAGHKRAIGRDV